MSTRLHILLEKVQGNNLYNVRDVKEITYIGISLTKKKELGLYTTFRMIKQWKTWEETCQGFM
jgi:hypothetical protein